MEFARAKKIFIVDDDELMLLALKDYLTRKVHHEVRTFKSGEECMEHITENPDIVILDYNLNTASRNAATGMEVLEAIKKNYPNIHIIMLSGQERYSIASQSIIKGAEQYVMKDKDAFEKVDQIVHELD